MPEDEEPQGKEDKAWVIIKTPLDKNSLLEFCQDIERLFRINPYLVFEKWQPIGDQHCRFEAVNQSQAPSFKIETVLKIEAKPNGLEVHYNRGLKSSTSFIIGTAAEGSTLTIIEKYNATSENERRKRLHEVDKSLTKWAQDIQTYLIHWQHWSWLSPWRYYKQCIWLPMKPAARRITFMLLLISVFEIALIALGATIYIIEYK